MKHVAWWFLVLGCTRDPIDPRDPVADPLPDTPDPTPCVPLAEVVADGVDQDCDGLDLCLVDADGDGSPADRTAAAPDCSARGFAGSGPIDCDDGDRRIHPGADERPGDRTDADCDGFELCFQDADGDGYRPDGVIASAGLDCRADGLTDRNTPAGDCDDSDPTVHVDAPEVAESGLDVDCDGRFTCRRDFDGDGFPGDRTVPSANAVCGDAPLEALPGLPDDCGLDRQILRFPGAVEIPGDGIDEDCDGLELCGVDADGDGYRLEALVAVADRRCNDLGLVDPAAPTGDCDDTDARIHPGAPERCNGADDDCDSVADPDLDGDGWSTCDVQSSAIVWSAREDAATAVLGGIDVDEDELPDVLVGHSEPGGGTVGVHRGLDGRELWTGPAPAGTGWFGEALVRGDLDADGVPEVIVGAPDTDGKVFGFPLAGLATGSPAWVVEGVELGLRLAVGDCDGDGIDDLLATGSGEVRLYLGSSGGPAATPAWTVAVRSWTAVALGDADGDGFADALVGQRLADDQAGRVDLYRGGPGGLETAPVWSRGGRPSDQLGASVALADFDGDGFADLAVAQTGQVGDDGALAVFAGGPDGPATEPVTRVDGRDLGRSFGDTMTVAGDVDGDGYTDLVVGAPEAVPFGRGAARVFLGSSLGLLPIPLPRLSNPQSSDYNGTVLGGVGDLDGDGRAEVAVGTVYDDAFAPGIDVWAITPRNDCDDADPTRFPGADCEGICGVDADLDGWRDADRPVTVTDDPTCAGFAPLALPIGDCDDADATIAPDREELVGDGVDQDCDRGELCFGDVDGDGFLGDDPPVIASADRDCDDLGEGRISSPFGDCVPDDGLVAPGAPPVCDGLDDDCDGLAEPDADGDGFYASCNGVLAESPFVVTDPDTSAGLGDEGTLADLNGDGYADLLFDVGRGYDGPIVVAYAGGPTGLALVPGWIGDLEGDDATAPADFDVGDVDGDGRGDLVVTASDGTRVFRGTAGFPEPLAAWLLATDGLVVEVADFDADGFAEIAVGDRFDADASGTVSVFAGSAGGPVEPPEILTGSADAFFGAGLAASDLDGDGRTDLVVGVPRGADPLVMYVGGDWSAPTWAVAAPGGIEVGRVIHLGDVDGDGAIDVLAADAYGEIHGWRGGPGGPETASSWTIGRGGVFGLGDFDGDGDADVVRTDAGALSVYLGGPSGPAAVPIGIAIADPDAGVLGVGDVDGDGRDDLMLGAPYWEADDGAYYLVEGVDAPDCDDGDAGIYPGNGC